MEYLVYGAISNEGNQDHRQMKAFVKLFSACPVMCHLQIVGALFIINLISCVVTGNNTRYVRRCGDDLTRTEGNPMIIICMLHSEWRGINTIAHILELLLATLAEGEQHLLLNVQFFYAQRCPCMRYTT